MLDPTRATRAWSRGHVLAALAFGAALGACFNPPAADVMFSCAPGAGAICPDGYTCAADGCCHRDGSDIAADFGGCGLGKDASAGPATTGSSTGAPDTTDTPTTSTAATTGTTGTTGTTDSSTGTPDTSTTGATGDGGTDSGSSSAGLTEQVGAHT